MPSYVWASTEPKPNTGSVSFDAGITGWKLHLVEMKDGGNTKCGHSREPALCGLRPKYGWGLDMYLCYPCERCKEKADRLGVNLAPMPGA